MAKKEIMHFNNFQEVLAYVNGNQKAEELKEYKKLAPKKAEKAEKPKAEPKAKKATKKKGAK